MAKMKPILFNTEMVRAILDGRKTVTRRVVKPQPWGTCPNTGGDHELEPDNFCGGVATGFVCRRCGHGVCPPHMKYPVGEALFRPMCWPGDILYVRETWCQYGKLDDSDRLIEGTEKYYYRADGENPTPFNDFLVQHPGWDEHRETPVWHPSIHMPKEAARLFIRVTAVRVERLQDIDAAGIVSEGLQIGDPFDILWDSTIKPADLDKYGWNANPWVWVIEYERCDKPEGV